MSDGIETKPLSLNRIKILFQLQIMYKMIEFERALLKNSQVRSQP